MPRTVNELTPEYRSLVAAKLLGDPTVEVAQFTVTPTPSYSRVSARSGSSRPRSTRRVVERAPVPEDQRKAMRERVYSDIAHVESLVDKCGPA